MTGFLSSSAMLSLILQGDLMTKTILGILGCMSILIWSIALYKTLLLRIKIAQLDASLVTVKKIQEFKQLLIFMQQHVKTVPGYFLSHCLVHLKDLLLSKKNGQKEYSQSLGLETLYMQSAGQVDQLIVQEESYVSVISVTAAVSPLLGLLGTVWGLVHAFIDISQKQSADIVTVAPGIAEALITTIAGLLVAIPAVILFYYVSSLIQQLQDQLYQLSDKFNMIAKNIILDQDIVQFEQIFEVKL